LILIAGSTRIEKSQKSHYNRRRRRGPVLCAVQYKSWRKMGPKRIWPTAFRCNSRVAVQGIVDRRINMTMIRTRIKTRRVGSRSGLSDLESR